ncbi:MAG TPA: SBBP repeat-containing protein [Verrucomicrobiae bacterium]
MKTWCFYCGTFLVVIACFVTNTLQADGHFAAEFASSPVSFEANFGQADPAVDFIAHGQNGNLLLTHGEAWLALQNNGTENSQCVLRLKLAGANPNPKVEGLNPLPGKANYILGNDPSRWRMDVFTFASVKYHEVYPGVDLVYYGNQQQLEYDLVVQPGANPNNIRLEFSDAEKISLAAAGDLVLQLAGDSIRQHKPIVYQETGGVRKILSGSYVLHSGMQVGFEIADYDQTKPLVIDPVLPFSATFGGSGLNQGLGVAVDGQDNVYVTGITTSGDFPTMNPFQTNKLGSYSAYVVKFDTNGAVVYSTFLGGGVLNDQTTTSTSGQGIAVDGNGDAFVTGYTTATNFPTKNPLQSKKGALSYSGRNAFVTELNPDGNALIYSTYLGGSNSDTATSIALDTNDDAIITGYTSSTNFPTVNAAQPVYGGNGDAFVAKLSADGSTLVYSTFLGGASFENEDVSLSGNAAPVGAVAVDFDGNAYVTGLTYSTNFPVLNAFQPTNATSFYGAYDAAFVTKLDPSGNLVYSTYFGGRLGDIGRAIGVDFQGNVYFAGNSFYGDLPTTNALQSSFGGRGAAGIGDGYVAALDATGTNLLYCTYLGGSGDDQVNGIAVRPEDGAVAVTGFTDSPNFPVLDAVQPAGEQGLFMSDNGATSWNLSNAGLASGVIYSIQVDPANPMIVYALTANGCFKSMDGGADWTSASSGLGYVAASTYGSPASLLALDPLHSGTIYVAGYAGIYKTTNGAAGWMLASAGIPSNPWVQTVAVDPNVPTTLYAGTYFNGLYKSTNGAATWNIATNGLNSLNFDALVVDPNNSSNVYAGAGAYTSIVSLYKSTNGGGNWSLLGGGLRGGAVNLLATSASTSTTIYSVVGNSLSYPPGSTPALQISTNGGLNWSSLLTAGGLSFTALASAPATTPALTIASSGNNDNVSWPASYAGYVLQSTPSLNPASWKTVMQSQVTSNGNYVITVTMAGSQGFYRLLLTNNASSSPPTLYLGTDQASGQGMLKSTDGGTTWYAAGPAGDTINTLAVNPAFPATVYAGLNGGRDAFVATLTPSGQLFSSTYSGGSGLDQGNAVAIGFTDAFVAGSTASSDFPITASPKSVVQEYTVKPNINTNPIVFSAGASASGPATVQKVTETFNCPTNEEFTYGGISTNTNFKVISGYHGFFWAGFPSSGGCQVIGLPPGVSLGTVNCVDGIGVYLKGKATTPGIYTIEFKCFAPPDCNWTITYTIPIN